MAKKARAAIGTTALTAIADRGYFKGEEILACHEASICTLVPPTKTSGAKAGGRFDKADFIYDPSKNEYRCPAGESLIWRFASVEKGMTNHRYWSSNCKGCLLTDKCTPGAQRRVTRWEHLDVLDGMLARLEQAPDAMRIRRWRVQIGRQSFILRFYTGWANSGPGSQSELAQTVYTRTQKNRIPFSFRPTYLFGKRMGVSINGIGTTLDAAEVNGLLYRSQDWVARWNRAQRPLNDLQ
ncbi:hypothetical protein HGB41_17695 [Massilia sp. ML15P13]|uniref:Transposase DDE domain-containing protein n=1 Tax=Telluria aromaticivorans TaxID=2725995 RepID=A0A7Y2P0D0_9BURK|nr:hypothetical protein [Telluria aromaticivorans]